MQEFTRRNLLKGLAALPLLGWLKPVETVAALMPKPKVPRLLREILVQRQFKGKHDRGGPRYEFGAWVQVRMSQLRVDDLFVMREVNQDGTHTKFFQDSPPETDDHYQTVQPSVFIVMNPPEQDPERGTWRIGAVYHSDIADNPLCKTLPGATLGVGSS